MALVPPAHVSENLEEFLAPRREAAGFRWTLPEQWHLTLAFCAAVPDRVLDDFAERLGRAAAKRRPMTARVAGGGGFPHPSGAKVLWAGLETDDPDREELRRLATGSRAAASKAGAEVDGGRFRAHLTMARMNRPTEVTNWVRLLDAYRGPVWEVEEIALVASYLGEGPRNRPRYETLGTWPLRCTTR